MRCGNLILLAVLLMATSGVAQEKGGKKAKPKEVTLKEASFKKGFFLLGQSVGGVKEEDLPKKGYSVKLSSTVLYFADVNGDEEITRDEDLMSMDSCRFFVQIPEVLLLPFGQFEISFKKDKRRFKLVLLEQDLGKHRSLLPDVADVTTYRIASGLRPIPLDLKTCDGCEKHCEYLFKNNLNDGKTGQDAHTEREGVPGYSEEGKAAAQGSSVHYEQATYRTALQSWWMTAWHRLAIISPCVKSFGAAHKHGVSMLHAPTYQPPVNMFTPADGQVLVPCSFAETGERPNPVPGTDGGIGCGYAVMLVLGSKDRYWGKKLEKVTLKDARSREAEGTISCPRSPANANWPSNSDAAMFIPKRPFSPNSWYEAAFFFEGEGAPVKWKFMTGR